MATKDSKLRLDILPQPDDTTCGPTCLHAVYRFWGDSVPLESVIASAGRLEEGGTLGVLLGNHALERGYAATLYTYNLQVFDPTWFDPGVPDLERRLRRRFDLKRGRKLRAAIQAYLRFLELGGKLAFEDLTENLIHRYIARSIPILTGLSATYLYRSPREFGPQDQPDDIRGDPAGHFVVLCGYSVERGKVEVADPLHPNPVADSPYYEVDMSRLIGSILLGTLTYDANLVIIEPR